MPKDAGPLPPDAIIIDTCALDDELGLGRPAAPSPGGPGASGKDLRRKNRRKHR